MHSNAFNMLRKLAATMPFGVGAFGVLRLADYGSRVSRPEVPRLEVSRQPTIKQINDKQYNNIHGNQQQIQPFGS